MVRGREGGVIGAGFGGALEGSICRGFGGGAFFFVFLGMDVWDELGLGFIRSTPSIIAMFPLRLR